MLSIPQSAYKTTQKLEEHITSPEIHNALQENTPSLKPKNILKKNNNANKSKKKKEKK